MATLSARDQVLNAHNPFRDSALRNAFEAPDDVPEIHADARARLRALIGECRREGLPRLQVVTGEPGDGKTHLLACLRAEADGSWHTDAPVSLASIDPLRELDFPFVHLLRGWASAASRRLGDGSTESDQPSSPLEFLLWRILRRAILSLGGDANPEVQSAVGAVGSLDPKKWPLMLAVTIREHWPALAGPLRDEVPRTAPFAPPMVDEEVWQAICALPESGRALSLCRWFSGRSLPEADLEALGVSASLDTENRAFLALSTLANLSDVPLVLGLDQLEGVRRLGEDAVPALFQALTTLYSAGGRLMVLLFCQAAIWADLRKAIPQHARDRLEPREITLGGVTPELGEKIIAQRLAPLWRGASATPPHPTAPFPPSWVRAEIESQGLRQPRRILALFAEVGLTDHPPVHASPPPAPKPDEQVQRGFSARRKQLEAEERSPDERAVIAQAGLAGVFKRFQGKQLGDTAVVAARKHRVREQGKEGLEVRLARAGREVRLYAEVHNALNGAAASAAVKRMEQALAQKAERALLVREESLPLPKAAAVRLEQMGPRGGVVHVPMAGLLDLGALEKVLDAAAAGELGVDAETTSAVVDATLVPEMIAVRALLDAAFQATAPAASGKAQQAIERAIEAPPHVVSAASVSRESGLSIEELNRAAEELELRGSVQLLTDKEGARGIARRPR